MQEIEAEARRLPPAERERLAYRIFETLHNQELTDVDEAWITVAEERFNAYLSGEDAGMDEDAFFAKTGELLGWK
ncbi:MAG: addiction module protein [Clostridiales bacterium]|nr:addiction module protein [Clostridiales bacterium]